MGTSKRAAGLPSPAISSCARRKPATWSSKSWPRKSNIYAISNGKPATAPETISSGAVNCGRHTKKKTPVVLACSIRPFLPCRRMYSMLPSPDDPYPVTDTQPGEIRIPLATLLVPLAVILIVIGWLASPRDAAGRPILLTPGVKAVEAYRRQSVSWSQGLRLADGETSRILADQSGDLFGRSQQAQRLFEQVLRIAQQIDRQSAPPTLYGL